MNSVAYVTENFFFMKRGWNKENTMSMIWYRKENITKKEYYDSFKDNAKKQNASATVPNPTTPSQENTSCNDKKSKIENAYEEASKIRQFEIQLYWERTKYFWAFITTIYVAYYNVFLNIYKQTNGKLPLLVLAALGFIFSVAWVLSNKGSKHWQENWENHIDLLEDEVTGPLHKIYKSNSFSVSKINQHLSYIISACSLGLLIFEIVEFCKKLNHLHKLFFYIILVLLFFIGFVAFLLNTKGNSKKNGTINFDRKIYY